MHADYLLAEQNHRALSMGEPAEEPCQAVKSTDKPVGRRSLDDSVFSLHAIFFNNNTRIYIMLYDVIVVGGGIR